MGLKVGSISRLISLPNHSAGSMISRSHSRTQLDAGWSNERLLRLFRTDRARVPDWVRIPDVAGATSTQRTAGYAAVAAAPTSQVRFIPSASIVK